MSETWANNMPRRIIARRRTRRGDIMEVKVVVSRDHQSELCGVTLLIVFYLGCSRSTPYEDDPARSRSRQQAQSPLAVAGKGR